MKKLPLNILIVEDDPDYNEIIHELLSYEIDSVSTAMNGVEALALIRSNTFHCVVSDIQMPFMDGLSLTRAVRSEGFEFPIILLTGQSHATEESIRSIGAMALLLKPLEFEDLLNKIRLLVPTV